MWNWLKAHWPRRFVKITLRVWVAALAIAFVGFALAFAREVRLIRAQPLTAWTEDASADCAVVLTGGLNRTREGFDLLSRHQVLKLIISGVNPGSDFRSIFPVWPYYGNIRTDDVILERRSLTTYGNAQQTLPLVEALRCRDILLITSRAHMRRALKTFTAQFPPGFPILTRTVSAGASEATRNEVSVEALKSIFYSLWAY